MNKNRFLLLLITLFSYQFMSAQTTYVNHAAAGANNGASWADAYTNLSNALANTTDGDVWVAAGTYQPTADSVSVEVRFGILNDVNLYGGFDGTETSIDDRDIEANTTTLSGDINGDDVVDDFENFKSDNVWHIVYVDSLLSGVIIDGFDIEGGTNYDSDDGAFFESGGGVFAYSEIAVKNCNFRQNLSDRGSAVTIIGGGTNGSALTDCLFEKNMAITSGVTYFLAMADGSVENCQFNNNITNRGCFYPSFCNGITVDNCSFDGNSNPFGFGAALWNWQTINFSVSECSFTNNAAEHAAAVYIDNREVDPHHTEYITFTDCDFSNNSADLSTDGGGTAGVIYFWKASYTMTDCTFSGNASNSSAGAIYNNGSDKTYVVTGCDFENNESSFGGAISNYGSNSFATFTDCDFKSNLSYSGGGAMINGFLSHVLIQDCLFEENTSAFGGALQNQNDSTIITIENSEFINNLSTSSGGAILNGFKVGVTIEESAFENNSAQWGGAVYNQNDSTQLTILESTFTGNEADNGGGGVFSSGKMEISITDSEFSGNLAGSFGGALSLFDGDIDGGHLALTNCIFSYNLANQGGAINIGDMDSDITSCLFFVNIAEETGTGGAISINAVDSTTLVVNMTNSTLVNNVGALAGGIASWEGGLESNSTLNLQNNIFYNPGFPNYAIEEGSPEVTSLGGNFSADETLADVLTHAKDSNGDDLDPLFADVDNVDFRLTAASPCVNAGVNENAPEFDIEGNARVGDVDLGAYESDFTIDVKEILLENAGQVKITPNPAISNISLIIENDWNGKLDVSIINAAGQVVKTAAFNKIQKKSNFDLDVSNLAAGSYTAKVRKGGEITTAVFVKL